VSVGEYVKEATPLFRLIADDVVKLRAAVPERYASRLKVGQHVTVNVEAYPDDFAGVITRINPQIDPANRTFQIEAVVPNEKHFLKPGAFARGQVETHVDAAVPFVPQEAIIAFAGVNKVFTVKDGKAVEAVVETGERKGELVEVVKGVGAGQSVVMSGASKLATGVAVTVKAEGAPTTRAAE